MIITGEIDDASLISHCQAENYSRFLETDGADVNCMETAERNYVADFAQKSLEHSQSRTCTGHYFTLFVNHFPLLICFLRYVFNNFGKNHTGITLLYRTQFYSRKTWGKTQLERGFPQT